MSQSGRKPWLKWAGCSAGCLVVGFIALLVAVPLIRIPSKSGAPHATSYPETGAVEAEPLLQLEDHTCGFLSLAAAYQSYGLSAEEENLRFRLGVDRRANPLDETTTGTLHPDFFRVLLQDSFDYKTLYPESDSTESRLRRHFESGDAALFLIARRENGNLHWVMSHAIENDQLRVVDSLEPAPYLEPLTEFLSELTLSIIAIRPRENASPNRDPHADGLAEMMRVRDRMVRKGISL